MDELTSSLSKTFTKADVVAIARELELESSGTKADVIEFILDEIDELSTPQDADEEIGWDTYDDSDLLVSFLEAADYINADGNWLAVEYYGGDEDVEEAPATIAIADVAVSTVDEPHCYAYADERDPSCRRCKLLDNCKIARIANRPKCFGIAFAEGDEQCVACLEIELCKKATNKR